ncbi:MAG: c-type cytochrome biogenesis protein CcmI [Paracoccaceae bacterium]
MVFWLLVIVIGGLVAAVLALAAVRAHGQRHVDGNDLQIYRDQLDEVSRDLVRQVISEAEAERLRLEVSRRLLDADKLARASGAATGAGANPVLAGSLALAVFGGAFWLYSVLGAQNYRDLPLEARIAAADAARAERPAQDAVEARARALAINPNADPRHVELLQDLRDALMARPDDLRGHLLLARNEAELGDYVAAHKALKRVIEIKAGAAEAADFANYADMLVLAAGGYVSPRAEAALRETLQREPENGTARYYVGLMYAQNDRPDLAFNLWRQLLEDSSSTAPWVAPIRGQIEFAAANAGVRYELPEQTKGPSAADIAAAEGMSEEQQSAMIRGMVERLSERLANEGGPAQDWAQLISTLGVLGQQERAAAIWEEAQTVFAASPGAIAVVRGAAERAGVAK